MAAMLAALVLGAAADMSGDAMTGIVIGVASAGRSAPDQLHALERARSRSRRHRRCFRARASIPYGMSTFFEKLGRRYGGSSQYVPELLQTHPVSVGPRRGSARPRAAAPRDDSTRAARRYALAKARVIALNAATPEAAFAAFRDKAEQRRAGRPLRACARFDAHVAARQRRAIVPRVSIEDYPNTMAFRVGQAEAMAASGATQPALELYADAIRLFPAQHPADDQLRRRR